MNDPIRMDGTVVIVSGGAGGLGMATARMLLEGGASVVLSDMEGDRLDAARETLSAIGPVTALPCDVSDPDQCSALVDETVRRHGRLDGLVAAAGMFRTAPLLDIEPEEWRRTIDVNLNGTFFLTRAAGRVMVDQGSGSIVVFSSVAGRSGRPFAAAYSAAKTGLLSLVKSSAGAFAPNVRVNAVCPGLVLTDMWRGIMRDRDELHGPGAGDAWLEEIASKSLVDRPGQPHEIASAVVFLLSDHASFITGQALNVCGGLEFN